MPVRAIDSDGDWEYGKGRNDYKSGLLEVEQNIKTRVNSFLGDCFFATNEGIDWFTLLGGKNENALNLAISVVVLNTPGVTSLLQLSVDLDEETRAFSVQYRVQTTYSQTLGGAFNIYDFGTQGG